MCPEDGKCTFDIIKNKSVVLKEDDFGASYIEEINNNNTLLKFEYIRNPLEGTQDSNYKEIIYINLDENFKNITKITDNVIFGRICFCRGQTGYYKIENGNLNIFNTTENNYQLNIDFSTKEVPHVINTINETFKL
ncbi:hypothetical protein [uncultured Olleya sp.]|uniref:hypothetical protein n=1 Tax=uncultured Olleya sp. TaxID=757243 RepID=UPI002593878B|nr:hypothetical protein [uncultured Olleya sp.]